MKKKFIMLTLCFTLIFSSINYKKVNAMDFVITPAMFYTVSALTVAYGLSVTDTDALYNLSREFVSFCGDTYEDTKILFNQCVSYSDNIVNVGKDFLSKFEDFLTVNKPKYEIDDVNYVTAYGGLPIYEGYYKTHFYSLSSLPATTMSFDNSYISYDDKIVYVNGINPGVHSTYFDRNTYSFLGFYCVSDNIHSIFYNKNQGFYQHIYLGTLSKRGFDLSELKYKNPFVGSYDDTTVKNNVNEDGSIGLVLNPNIDNLIGKNPSDIIYDGTNGGIYDGTISIPNVSNPSINVDGDLSFPVPDVDLPDVDVPDVPVENIWSNVTDYIIGLVVPSDSFWVDTWGGLYNNFTSSFPMVDMDNFNNLVTGEKKFPNIDINIMGVTGRVVNGDVINSIVDWLRPIIAGFMMICLMLFNYRKIYKLIRNSEPFGGVASGTSDFKTGISEYSHIGLVNDGFKRSEEEEFARSRYYEEMYFKNGGKL